MAKPFAVVVVLVVRVRLAVASYLAGTRRLRNLRQSRVVNKSHSSVFAS